jgi:hypothetical protein
LRLLSSENRVTSLSSVIDIKRMNVFSLQHVGIGGSCVGTSSHFCSSVG